VQRLIAEAGVVVTVPSPVGMHRLHPHHRRIPAHFSAVTSSRNSGRHNSTYLAYDTPCRHILLPAVPPPCAVWTCQFQSPGCAARWQRAAARHSLLRPLGAQPSSSNRRHCSSSSSEHTARSCWSCQCAARAADTRAHWGCVGCGV
jgi:hypothetical protein